MFPNVTKKKSRETAVKKKKKRKTEELGQPLRSLTDKVFILVIRDNLLVA